MFVSWVNTHHIKQMIKANKATIFPKKNVEGRITLFKMIQNPSYLSLKIKGKPFQIITFYHHQPSQKKHASAS